MPPPPHPTQKTTPTKQTTPKEKKQTILDLLRNENAKFWQKTVEKKLENNDTVRGNKGSKGRTKTANPIWA